MKKYEDLIEPNLDRSFIHRIDPRCKLILLIVFSLLVIVLDKPVSLFIIFSLAVLSHIIAKTPYQKFKVLLVIISLGIWGCMFSQALFYSKYPRTIILVIIPDFLYVYQEGLIWGATQALRFSTMTTLGMLLVWTTDTRELLHALVKLKIPYTISFMAITSVRFLPLILQEVGTVISIEKLKGYKPLKIGLVRPVKTLNTTLKPVLFNLIRKSTTLSLSVESRGFNPKGKRTFLYELNFSKFDKIIIFTTLSLTIITVIMKIFYLLYLNEIFYLSSLRWIYEINRRWM